MNVVSHAADCDSFHPVFPRDAAHVRPEARLHVGHDYIASFLRAEDAMQKLTDVRVSHDTRDLVSAVPYGTRIVI